MKNHYKLILLSCMAAMILTMVSCEKEESVKLADLGTHSVTQITTNTAQSGGNITSDGGGEVTSYGVVWNTLSNPSIDQHVGLTMDGTGKGEFQSIMSGLQPNTAYFVRAYATNEAGVVYGNEQQFTTLGALPEVTTNAVINITWNSATGGGNVIHDGGAAIIACGLVYGTSPNPTTSDSTVVSVNDTGVFTVTITGLEPFTTYFVRAYATNEVGTSYGEQVSFKTDALQIGDSYQGGIVAYILQPGDPGYVEGEFHGLIAAPFDISLDIEWGCDGKLIGGTSTDMGTGMANTMAITNGCTTEGTPARICNDLELNGYSDWYLPSKDELIKLQISKDAIGGFDFFYWSSSEYSSTLAWGQGFHDGNLWATSKYTLMRVRAVRTF